MIEHTYHNDKYVFVQKDKKEYSYDIENNEFTEQDIPQSVRDEVEDYILNRMYE